MNLIYLLKKGKLFYGALLFACCFPLLSFSQCPGVTLQGVATESRCEASGTLTIDVNGAPGSSSITYGIVSAPALFPSAQLGHYQSSNLFEALPVGSYQIEVQVSGGSGSCISSIDLFVPGNYVQMDVTQAVSNNTKCSGMPGDGSISVQAINGRQLAGGGYSYALILPAAYGSVNTNGVFSNLPEGTYTIRAYDSCGNFQSRDITVGTTVRSYIPMAGNAEHTGCSQVEAQILLYDPATAQYTNANSYTGYTYGYYNDAGNFVGYLPMADFITTHTNVFQIARDTFSVFIKDLCGNIRNTGLFHLSNFNYYGFTGSFAEGLTTSASCANFNVNLSNYLYDKGTNPKFTITCAPDSSVIGQSSYTGIFTNLLYGNYCYEITDDCGRSKTFDFSKNYNGLLLYSSTLSQHSCTNKYGSLVLDGPYSVSAPLKVEVIDSIMNVSGTLMRTLVYNTVTNNMIVADSLPMGKNIFLKFSDVCSNPVTLGPFLFSPLNINTWNNITPLCVNKANLTHAVIPSDPLLLSLDGITTVVTGSDGIDYAWFSSWVTSPVYTPKNDTIQVNNLPVGTYIIKTYSDESCINNYYVDTFSVLPYTQPTLLDATSFTCNGSIANNYSLTLSATGGIPNFTYEITGSTPNNIVRAPQSSNAFQNLPINENIQLRMVDGCGNTSSNAVIIKDFLPRTINALGSTCAGGNVVLHVQPLPGDADYTWRFNGTIISSGLNDTTVSLAPFSNINYGDYTVEVLPALGCQPVQSSLTLTNTCSSLPVDFIGFTGTTKNNFVSLEWKTTRETGVDYFEIEKSLDGIQYSRIGTQAAGNELSLVYTYKFSDSQPLAQRTYYRIRVINLNGNKEHSETISFVPGSAFLNTVNIAPNPFNARLTLNLNSKTVFKATVSMYDAQGRLVLAEEWKINSGQNQKMISPKTILSNGIYLIRITTSNNELIFRSSVLKQ